MKYKKQIATGALALSLLIGGSTVLAATPRDLGIKNFELDSQRENKHKREEIRNKKRNHIIGTILSINQNGFILEVKNPKTKEISSIDIKVNDSTKYHKNGLVISLADLNIGQKAIITGSLDRTTNILVAKKVKVVILKK